MHKKPLFLIFIFQLIKIILSSNIITEENFKVIPLPKKIKQMKGNPFILSSTTKIIFQENDSSLERISNYLSEYIKDKTNLILKKTSKIPKIKKNLILLLYDDTLEKEEYKITINQNLIIFSSSTPNGIFYACQTFRKSLPIEKKRREKFMEIIRKRQSEYNKFNKEVKNEEKKVENEFWIEEILKSEEVLESSGEF